MTFHISSPGNEPSARSPLALLRYPRHGVMAFAAIPNCRASTVAAGEFLATSGSQLAAADQAGHRQQHHPTEHQRPPAPRAGPQNRP